MKCLLLALTSLLFILYAYGQNPKDNSKALLVTEKDSTKEVSHKIEIANKQFEGLKGKLPFPVDSFISYDPCEKCEYSQVSSLKLICKENTPVKAIAASVVVLITYIGDTQGIICRSGEYYICYIRVKNIVVKKGDQLHTGDILAITDDCSNEDSSLEVLLSTKENKRLFPSKWFKLPAQHINTVIKN